MLCILCAYVSSTWVLIVSLSIALNPSLLPLSDLPPHSSFSLLPAELSIQYGAAGIIVSNHGARQLDYVNATIMALEEVRGRGHGRVLRLCAVEHRTYKQSVSMLEQAKFAAWWCYSAHCMSYCAHSRVFRPADPLTTMIIPCLSSNATVTLL